MPVFVDSTSDRGYRNVTGRAEPGVRAPARISRCARAPGTPPAAPNTPSRISSPAISSTAPMISRTACIRWKVDYRSADGLGVRITVSRANDDIDQLQANFGRLRFRAHAARQRRRCRWICPEFGDHALTLRPAAQRRGHRAPTPSAPRFDERHLASRRPSCRTSSRSAASARALALGGVDHETFGSELTWNAEVGVGFRHRHARHAVGRQGLPRAGRHRPLRLRRQSGSAARSVAPGGTDHCARSWASTSSCRCRPSTTASAISSTTWCSISTPSTARTRTSTARASRAWSWAGRSRGEAWRARAELTLQDPRDEDTRRRACCAARARRCAWR